MFDITIVYVNYFTKQDILSAIETLVEDIKNCPYLVQITIADNSMNQDHIREAAAKYPNVTYIDCGGNVGFGAANTIGFQQSKARYYFALNRDTLIPEQSGTITRVIKFMDAHPRIGCIGPKLLNMDGSLQYACYRFDLASILIKPLKHLQFDKKYRAVKRFSDRYLMKDFDHESTRPVDWVLGAAMVVRHEVVEKIGWFDKRFFMYFEDCDWCRTMWEHGFPVYYVHDITIQHRHVRESAKIPGVIRALWKNKLARYHLASWCKYLAKWRGKHSYYEPIA